MDKLEETLKIITSEQFVLPETNDCDIGNITTYKRFTILLPASEMGVIW